MDLVSKNRELYNKEKEEHNEWKKLLTRLSRLNKQSLISATISQWHNNRLVELQKPGYRIPMSGYWPNFQRCWKPSTMVIEDYKHICNSWALHSKEGSYYCVECGIRHEDDYTGNKICDWSEDAYYIAFEDYLTRTKKELLDLLGQYKENSHRSQ